MKEISFISNKPTGKDCFESRSHDKIANSIAEHIKNEHSSMKVIGLEGEWGSGKSNVVEIIKNKLSNTHYIYIYDSWGHQEDSQRRAFLEEITDELVENNLLTKKTKYKNIDGKILNISWQEKIKYLLARKKEINKKTVPKISIGFIIIGIVVFLTPLFTILSTILLDDDNIWWKKILFTSIPVILSLIAYIIASFKEQKLIDISSLFYLYKGKELENTTIEILSDLEPSVKEFKDWIKSISEGLTNKKLVIVYDNMDRLPPEKVKEVWSSIHTFFAEEEYEKIHIVIPFDRKHLQKAFDDDAVQANEFINKTFSLSYRVTPPILTDWKRFFRTKFNEAFHDSEDEEFPLVLSIFDRLKQRFTPRDIIVFINELVSYKKIWMDDIPLRYIALFIIQKELILEDAHKNILESNYLKNIEELFANDKDLQKYISALVFNVPIEQSLQVLLIRDTELTLRDEEGSLDINVLANNEYFIEILEEVVKTSEIILDKAIEVLSQLDKEKIQDDNLEKRLKTIWDILAEKQLNKDIEELSFNENYKSLLLNTSNNIRDSIIKYLIKQFNNFKEINGEDYFKSFQDLENFIEENDINFDITANIEEISAKEDVFLDYLQIANENYKKYKLTTNFEELDTFIANKITDEIANIHLINLSNILEECNFNKTKEKIEKIISSNKLTQDYFCQILAIYKSISEDKPLTEIVKMPNLYQLLERVEEGNYGFYDLVALRIKYGNQYKCNTRGMPSQAWKDKLSDILNSDDQEKVKEVAKQIEYYISYGDLLLLATKWEKPLLKEVCKELICNSYGTQRMNIIESLKNFEKIKNALDIDEKDLLGSLDGWTKYAKKSITIDNIKEVIDYNFYKYSISVSLDLTRYINEIAKEYINSCEKDTLIKEWGNQKSYVYNALYIFMDNGEIEKLPKNVSSAMKEKMIEISKSEANIPNEDSIWSFFIEKIDRNKITPTIKDIRDYFIRENNIDCNSFKFFEQFFREIGNLEEKSGDVTRTILTKVIADEKCLEIILQNQDFYATIINDSGNDAENLKDEILNKLQNSENSKLKSFAKKINIQSLESLNDK